MTWQKESPSDMVFWKRFSLEGIPPEEFLEIHDPALLRQVEAASGKLVAQLLPTASPFLPESAATHCVHFGDAEVLSHSYAIGGMQVTLVHSPDGGLILPNVDLGPPSEHLATAQRVAAALFRTAGAPFLPMSFKASDESVRFSNIGVGAMGVLPQGTIHGGVKAGRLYFVIFNHPDPLSQSPFIRARGWLGPGLRMAWEARQSQLAALRAPSPPPPPDFGLRGARAIPAVDPQDNLFWNRWGLESIEPAAFVPLEATGDLRAAATGSGRLFDAIMRPGAELYATAGRQHAFHVEPSCLLHRFDFEGIPLLVYEDDDSVMVRISATRVLGEDSHEFVRRMMGLLLRDVAGKWGFFEAKGSDESETFEGSCRSERVGSPIPIHGAVLTLATPRGAKTVGLYFAISRASAPAHLRGGRPLINDHLRSVWAKAH